MKNNLKDTFIDTVIKFYSEATPGIDNFLKEKLSNDPDQFLEKFLNYTDVDTKKLATKKKNAYNHAKLNFRDFCTTSIRSAYKLADIPQNDSPGIEAIRMTIETITNSMAPAKESSQKMR